jgi:NAD(P)-dependent dehydrogenase (short-subunit alcohol dehydrogenase family)
MTVAGNHLGAALLTLLLLDRLKASAPSRIIDVSSEAQRNARLDMGVMKPFMLNSKQELKALCISRRRPKLPGPPGNISSSLSPQNRIPSREIRKSPQKFGNGPKK